MLSNLLQVLQTLILPPHNRGHAPKSCSFQLLTSVQGITKLQQPDVVLGHTVNQVPGRVYLAQSQLVMVLNLQTMNKMHNFLLYRPCRTKRS